MSKKFSQWEVLDIISRLEQNDSQPFFTEIAAQRDAIEHGLRDTKSSFQNKALSRAKQLAHATSIQKYYQSVNSKTHFAQWALVACMAFLGSFAVINVFDDALKQVNIFWLIIVLLGVNTVSMLLYLSSSLQKKVDLRSIPTLLFKGILSLFTKKFSTISSSEKNNFIHSWSTMNLTGNVGRWSLSRYLHGAWLAYLFGALAALVLILLAKQINFVWGTTLLNGDFFIQLTSNMSTLQSSLGLPTLSVDQILLSRVSDSSNQTIMTSTQDLAQNRQQWAYFLIVSLLLYGIFPRFLLWCYSVFKQRQAKKIYQPEWNTPYFVQLRERMIPSSSAAAIVDADTHKTAPVSGNNESDTVKLQSNEQRINVLDLANSLTDKTQILAYEWFPRHPWPIIDVPNNLGIISNREEQQSLLNQLKGTPEGHTLAVCLSSEQVADRGALRFFSSLSQHAELQLLIFDFSAHMHLKRRWTEWLHLADQLKISHERVFLVDARQADSQQSH